MLIDGGYDACFFVELGYVIKKEIMTGEYWKW